MPYKEAPPFIRVTCARDQIEPITITYDQIKTIGPGNFKVFVQGGQMECHVLSGKPNCAGRCQISKFCRLRRIPGLDHDEI